MYLFFDTETTGFPTHPTSDYRNWPRMVQLAWIVANDKGDILEQHSHIIRPDGYSIPERVTKIHGISTEKAYAEGDPLEYVLREFLISLSYSQVVVAHNYQFDYGVVRSELLRHDIPDFLHPYDAYCTMTAKSVVQYCQVLRGDNRRKWPKLGELYHLLFNDEFHNAHDALADTEACARCFFELKKLGIF